MPVLWNRLSDRLTYQPVPGKTREQESCGCGGHGCTKCGGLECLCRPRFFDGQLLTDEDLNRLDSYIVAKQRLHNRYLHGWGVVCGLEVLCHACEGFVTVRAGYALSPCGADIVVCKDDVVNICELMEACRPEPPECKPWRPYGDRNDCQDQPEEWVLVICYEERPSRGVKALHSAPRAGSCARCNCGQPSHMTGGANGKGGQACGCGCHATPSSRPTSHTRQRGSAANQCEPTQICESYRFELRPAAALRRSTKPEKGRLVAEAAYVMNEVRASLPQPPNRVVSQEWEHWHYAVRDIYHQVLVQYGGQYCTAIDQLKEVPIPDPRAHLNADAYVAEVTVATQRLSVVMANSLQSIFCAALLPPCPLPAQDDCVPLASIRVRGRSCKIVHICNVDVRETAITTAALQYWLSVLPIGKTLRTYLGRLCCRPLRTDHVRIRQFGRANIRRAVGAEPTAPVEGFAASTAEGADDEAARLDRLRLAAETLGDTPVASIAPHAESAGDEAGRVDERARGEGLFNLVREAGKRRGVPVNAYMQLLDALGAIDDKGQPLLSSLERENPVESILLNELVELAAPLMESIGSDAAVEFSARDVDSELSELRAMMAKQQEIIAEMQREISNLRGHEE